MAVKGQKAAMPRNRSALVAVVLVASLSILLALFFNLFGIFEQPTIRIRVACVGDSITEGTTYPNDLSNLLGANYSVGNFGAGGATVSLESEKPYLFQPEFKEATRFLPDIVIIMLGTNDATYLPTQHIFNFTSDYKKLIEEFQTLTSKPEIWLVKPPPIFNNGTGLSTPDFASQIIPKIQQVANETAHPLIDAYTPLVNHPEDFVDGVHPNGEGAKIIATQVFDAITSSKTYSLFATND